MAVTINGDTGVDKVVDNTITTDDIQDGAVYDVKINSLSSSKLTGALPAISGANLTALTSANLTGA